MLYKSTFNLCPLENKCCIVSALNEAYQMLNEQAIDID